MNGAVSRTRLGINRWLVTPFWILFCPGLGYYCADGGARKAAVFLRSDFHREFESISLQQTVRLSPASAFEGREPRLSARVSAGGVATGSAETRRGHCHGN